MTECDFAYRYFHKRKSYKKARWKKAIKRFVIREDWADWFLR